MGCDALAFRIQSRINELKSEQVRLKTFIESDQVRREALAKAIEELHWVLKQVAGEGE